MKTTSSTTSSLLFSLMPHDKVYYLVWSVVTQDTTYVCRSPGSSLRLSLLSCQFAVARLSEGGVIVVTCFACFKFSTRLSISWKKFTCSICARVISNLTLLITSVYLFFVSTKTASILPYWKSIFFFSQILSLLLWPIPLHWRHPFYLLFTARALNRFFLYWTSKRKIMIE